MMDKCLLPQVLVSRPLRMMSLAREAALDADQPLPLPDDEALNLIVAEVMRPFGYRLR